MSDFLVFEGNCWKFGHNIPTDEIAPTHVVWKSFSEMANHVFESLNPDFPVKVQKGDIVVAGRNFGCSSGRAIVPNAIKATGLGGIDAGLSTTGGTSDGCFIAEICPQVVEPGPPWPSIHRIDEHVADAELEPLKNKYRRLLTKLVGA